MTTALAMVLAVLLDAWLGEPRRWHPLVQFGRLARHIESRCHADRRVAGVIAWIIAVVPLVAIAWWLMALFHSWAPWLSFAFDVAVLYLAIGLRSLADHAMPVAHALSGGDLASARAAVGRMVSRDTGVLDKAQVAAAATESVLENGNDAVFGALFWFAVLGAPGAVLYRLANTLDAMWGYRTQRYERYGWAAARIDDVLNFLPARLTAMSYVLLGDAMRAWRCWRTQAPSWDSPNAGPVMAAGAGALGVCLGGAAPYDGVWEMRPALGEGELPDAHAIVRALQLVRRSVALWLGVAMLLALAAWSAGHA
ncbi:adenosylcobinamide-phosphate synthase [Dyella jiangningensis]|uniref:adenosylcobinamide-phosphate synthase CbiB n=1 Tax=Dyella sp. AtDHG13 TaxID=1938897 RepID=UPI000888B7F2|nr:adenosylcobinamide-phosphate synthase CbiB [Dyella sp. AtDHG13]PXV54776.1 adenosylcobinamide-phosphate synthase [Dyella sp. AtDHG13]SDK85076.1 adenosylcobinamide-phosphate synthase [Dyella jiangningensis]